MGSLEEGMSSDEDRPINDIDKPAIVCVVCMCVYTLCVVCCVVLLYVCVCDVSACGEGQNSSKEGGWGRR